MSTHALELELGLFSNVAHEPLLLHPPARGGRVMLCTSVPASPGKDKGPWRNELVDVGNLAARLATLEQLEGHAYYVTQHTLRADARSRKAQEVQWLNSLWVDLDLVGDRYPEEYEVAWLPRRSPRMRTAATATGRIAPAAPDLTSAGPAHRATEGRLAAARRWPVCSCRPLGAAFFWACVETGSPLLTQYDRLQRAAERALVRLCLARQINAIAFGHCGRSFRLGLRGADAARPGTLGKGCGVDDCRL
jgi:hypothetical protein